MQIPPPVTASQIVRTLLTYVGVAAVLGYVALVAFHRREWVSFAVWGSVGTAWVLLLPWKNRTALRSLTHSALGGPKLTPLRTDKAGQTVSHCPICGADAEINLATGTITCAKCGMRGTITAA